MAELITRTTAWDLEIRGDGRTVTGIVVPYNKPAPIVDVGGRYTEVFVPGAFARTVAERQGRVKFLAHHDARSMPLGRSTLLREDQNGLYGEFRVSQTVAGDEALALIRDGALDAFSIGFSPLRDDWSRDRSSVTRVEARLREVSAVNFPAYEDALISGVRAATGPSLSSDVAARRLALLRTEF